jgi:hypothetical protein
MNNCQCVTTPEYALKSEIENSVVVEMGLLINNPNRDGIYNNMKFVIERAEKMLGLLNEIAEQQERLKERMFAAEKKNDSDIEKVVIEMPDSDKRFNRVQELHKQGYRILQDTSEKVILIKFKGKK